MAIWEAPAAFDDFVRSRHTELLRFAHVLTGDRQLAEDLVQDALERAGTSWRRLRKQDDPEGYVRRIIVNRHLNRLRGLRRERLVAEVPDRAGPAAEPVDEHLWHLLRTLPPRQRTVIVLRFYADLSEVQIAEAMSCSIGTVKSNGARAMAKLRTAMDATDPVRTTS